MQGSRSPVAEIARDPRDEAAADAVTAMSRSRRRGVILGIAVALACLAVVYARKNAPALQRIGATATVTELTSGATLQARVDTGALLCSIHCEEIVVPDADADPSDVVGQPIRFRIVDNGGKSHWIETDVVDLSSIRTTSLTAKRYCVRLPLRVQGVEATVLVTLNDRRNMRYPFLIGRNLLRDRFVVDVSQNSDDVPAAE